MWGLGCLLWEMYNGSLSQVSALRNTSKVGQCILIDGKNLLFILSLSLSLSQLPKPLVPHYMECVSANPKSRPSPSSLLSRLREHGGFLATPLVSIALRIEELQVSARGYWNGSEGAPR